MASLNDCCIVCGEPLGEGNIYEYCSLECKFNPKHEEKQEEA